MLASVAATVGAVAAPSAAFASASSAEQQFIADMNAAREANGLRPYSVASDLTSIARQHSRDMAAKQSLYHNPNLTSQVQNWQAVGENVGEGPTEPDIQSAFMHSPEHRANILDHDFTQVGVGVTIDSNGTIWVTEDFRQPMGSTSYSAPRTTTHHTYSAPTHSSSNSQPVVQHQAAHPTATPAAVLRAKLAAMRSASVVAARADPVSQAFHFLTTVSTLSS